MKPAWMQYARYKPFKGMRGIACLLDLLDFTEGSWAIIYVPLVVRPFLYTKDYAHRINVCTHPLLKYDTNTISDNIQQDKIVREER